MILRQSWRGVVILRPNASGVMMMVYDFKAKNKNVIQANEYMFAKTLSMFEWEGLPETIPYREIEKLLQRTGYAFVTMVKDPEDDVEKLYAFNGGLGGIPDVYGNPTEIIIANPALKLNKTYNLLKDGVLIINDDSKLGLTPILNKYHLMMVENDLNMVIHGYNNRIGTLISASDDKTKASADLFLTKIVDGDMAVIGESALFDGVKSHQSSRTDPITSLIEYQQYMKASLFNEVGLNANFNMKRERLNSAEVLQNEDTIYPFVDNMMKCRLKGVQALNAMYDLSIDIDYGSVWGDKRRERVDDVVVLEGKPVDTDRDVAAGETDVVDTTVPVTEDEVVVDTTVTEEVVDGTDDKFETASVDTVEVKTEVVEDVEVIEDKPEVIDSVDEDQTQPESESESEPVVEEVNSEKPTVGEVILEVIVAAEASGVIQEVVADELEALAELVVEDIKDEIK